MTSFSINSTFGYFGVF